MPGVTDEQIAAARSVDLLTYLQSREPGSLRKSGGEYCLAEHDSLKISHGKWFWFSRGVGSNNALDFLIQVRGLNFTEAVNTLTNGHTTPMFPGRKPLPPEEVKRLFALPLPYRDSFRAIAYLMGRGIDREVIDECVKAGSLYESNDRHNCVFVGFDGDKPRFACLRGTFGNFKQDIPGSDKRYSFSIPAQGESKIVNVFESPVDALSFISMQRANWGGGVEWRNEHYLSLGGVSSRALNQFLTAYPEINNVRLLLDNDVAGIDAMARITAELKSNPKYSGLSVMSEPSPIGKDWSDLVQYLKNQDRAVKLQGRAKDAAISL